MEPWQKISLILCAYGVLKEFRPSEPFVTKYLNHPPMNFTREQISEDIYPIAIYSTMVLLIFIFLITDLLRYKPIIILNSLSGIVIYLMLIFCRKLIAMQIVEVLYGLFTACEVAYYTYIYAKVDKEHYQEVSGQTRAAYLVGRAVSGIFSQILVSWANFSYYVLNFFTLGGMVLSLFWALLLPSVSQSIYFNKTINQTLANESAASSTTNLVDNQTETRYSENKIIRGFQFLWIDFKTAFTNIYVVKWAFWWALATCGYYQILSYVQLLWEEILKDEGNEYYTKLNGGVEAAYTVASALAALCISKINVNWSIFGELVLFLCSIVIGVLLTIMAVTSSIWVAYGTKVVYAMIYHSMITISNSEVAKHVNPDSYGLIFGFTSFIAYVLQTILTAIVIGALKLPIRIQFEVYGGYFAVLGIIFGVKSLATFLWHKCRSTNRIDLVTAEHS
ncbi:hypothetical protein O3M35_010813 [Rhynocoris fuscipes]|uniref:Thiamine transporter 2 n=1 Tax=Rhynocoris fuscipes TaxID=488301 RepID=A0AAW1D1D4_9HEMI